ncbi:MAG TPA: type IX secretion system membrane protein PorP/SprF [Cyclobacteriaceae bacterium]|nr:type IX secretion system membrane protein PorP/SprF [Cyclobacteriaceae bacterium]
MRKLLLIILVVAAQNAVAQQDPLYAQYLTNPLLFNPAYAGLNNALNASLSFRNQWTGYEGSPTTVNLNGHMSLVDNKVGIGGMVIRDALGPTKNTEAHLLASYKIKFNSTKQYQLSFGMQAGMISSVNNYSKLRLDNPSDPSFSQNMNFTWPNIGFGAILMGEKFLLGVSVPRMLKGKTEDGGVVYNQHMYLFTSYVHYLGTRLRLKPSLLVRGVSGGPLSADVNVNINIDTKYTAGVFVRNFNTYGALFQMWVRDKLRLGYAVELPAGNSVGANFTSHEVTIGIKTAVLNIHERSYSEF